MRDRKIFNMFVEIVLLGLLLLMPVSVGSMIYLTCLRLYMNNQCRLIYIWLEETHGLCPPKHPLQKNSINTLIPVMTQDLNSLSVTTTILVSQR